MLPPDPWFLPVFRRQSRRVENFSRARLGRNFQLKFRTRNSGTAAQYCRHQGSAPTISPLFWVNRHKHMNSLQVGSGRLWTHRSRAPNGARARAPTTL